MRRPSTKTLAIVAIAAGAVLLAAAGVIGVTAAGNGPAHNGNDTLPAVMANASQNRAELAIKQIQDRLRDNPRDADAWARLGAAYVERARVTADPTYYSKAQDALRQSLTLAPEGNNGPALIGMGALANARHEFTAARDWALRAQPVLPDNPQRYGVLADAMTQLGEYPAATQAIQRMLDLRPSIASFTRASYDFELHGQLDQTRQAMQRALADANSPDQAAFCHYQLGELAFNAGNLDEAQSQYEAAPDQVLSRHGQAKVAAARGNLDAALDSYRELVATVPSPAYLRDYAELLTVAGRPSEADAQYAVLAKQQQLAPDNLEASIVAASRGDGQNALRLARAEWDRRKDNIDVADALAWALHLTGQDAQALTHADQAARLGGMNATFAYHQGMILRGLGRTEQATEALATALRINPYFSPVHAPLAKAALAQLRAGR